MTFGTGFARACALAGALSLLAPLAVADLGAFVIKRFDEVKNR